MNTQNTSANPKENSGLALAGMILSIIGLVCSLLANWRTIGVVIGAVGLLVSAFSLYKIKTTRAKSVRATTGIIFGIIAIVLGGYFLYVTSNKNNEEQVAPNGVTDTTSNSGDNENSLKKLEGITDSTKTN